MRQWDRLYYVGADAKQSGVLQGELAVEMIRQNSQIDHNKDGKNSVCSSGRGSGTSGCDHSYRKCGRYA